MSSGRSTVCSLCCHESSAWAVGSCDHPSCLTCCAKLRVLCGQKECAVCREKLDQVVVVAEPKSFSSIQISGLRSDQKHGFLFSNQKLFSLYKSLKENKCTLCPEMPSFRTFASLREHTRKCHNRLYCEICTSNLKLFPWEFKTYTRQELTRHRREGDSEDKSYKGHPLCQFCDDRYMDNDTLHMHLRQSHFWCHFCESNGKQEYYSDYPFLRKHFKEDHYLCEEGACREEKLTSVFQSKIDLQAHRASAHAKGLSKSEVKQLRQIEVGFTYTKAPESDGMPPPHMRYGARGQWQSQQSQRAQMKERESFEVATAISLSLQQSSQQKSSKSNEENKRVRNRSPVAVKSSKLHDQPKQQSLEKNKKVALDSYMQRSELEQGLGVSKSKKPPGFETVSNSTIKGMGTTEVEWPDPTEWPEVTPKPTQEWPTDLPTGFPSYSVMGMEQPKPDIPSQVPFPLPGLMLGSDHSGPNPPPGFTIGTGLKDISPPFSNQYRHQQHQDSRNDHKALEAEVIQRARKMLGYDNGKLSLFKTLSGWYRNSEISVEEYAAQCHQLFGDQAWQEIGPQLARVLPVQSKQRELLSLFSASRANDIPVGRKGKSKKSKSRVAEPPGLQRPWMSGRPPANIGLHSLLLSEEEYPTLNAAAKQPDPPKELQHWNMKVSA